MAFPICNEPTEHEYRPFCSKRCADIDLGRWMTGVYAVPSTDPEDIEEALEAAEREAAKDTPKPH